MTDEVPKEFKAPQGRLDYWLHAGVVGAAFLLFGVALISQVFGDVQRVRYLGFEPLRSDEEILLLQTEPRSIYVLSKGIAKGLKVGCTYDFRYSTWERIYKRPLPRPEDEVRSVKFVTLIECP